MRIINIVLKEISIISFTVHDEYVTLQIHYENPQSIIMKKTLTILAPGTAAAQIIHEIKKTENLKNYKPEGTRYMDNYVHIIFENQESVQKQLQHFLEDLQIKIKEIKNKTDSTNYLSLVRELMELKFTLAYSRELPG
jgi:hypothetical protein